MRKRNIIGFAAATILILLVPLVAMQFTREVNWSVTDFLVAGALLFGTGLAYEFIAARLAKTSHRMAAGVVLAAVLLLVWAQFAVGIL